MNRLNYSAHPGIEQGVHSPGATFLYEVYLACRNSPRAAPRISCAGADAHTTNGQRKRPSIRTDIQSSPLSSKASIFQAPCSFVSGISPMGLVLKPSVARAWPPFTRRSIISICDTSSAFRC